jgi:hypothetical protein
LKFQVTDSAYINVLKRVESSTPPPLVCYICNIYFPIGGVDTTSSLNGSVTSVTRNVLLAANAVTFRNIPGFTYDITPPVMMIMI